MSLLHVSLDFISNIRVLFSKIMAGVFWVGYILSGKKASLQMNPTDTVALVNYENFSKEVFEGNPLRLEYKLTSFGNTLITVIDAMQKWGDKYSKK